MLSLTGFELNKVGITHDDIKDKEVTWHEALGQNHYYGKAIDEICAIHFPHMLEKEKKNEGKITQAQSDHALKTWNTLGQKNDRNFDIDDDMYHAYLFSYFNEEDLQEAISVIPHRKEFEARIEFVKNLGRKQEELPEGTVAGYTCPSQLNELDDNTTENLLSEYYKNLIQVSDVDSEISSMNITKFKKCNEINENVDEDINYECDDMLFDLYSSNYPDLYYVLNEYAVHITKVEVVTQYIMTTFYSIPDSQPKDPFKPAVILWGHNISHWIIDQNTIGYHA